MESFLDIDREQDIKLAVCFNMLVSLTIKFFRFVRMV